MPTPELAVTSVPYADHSEDALVLAVPTVAEAGDSLGALAPALEAIGFAGSRGSYARVYAPEVTTSPLAVVGLGSEADADAVREAIGAGTRQLTGFDSVAVAVATGPTDQWRAAAEGAVLGAYSFDAYKSDPESARARRHATRIVVHAPQGAADGDLAEARAVGEAVALVKDLVSTPAADQSPAQLAATAEARTADLPITATVWDEESLATGGFGGILGVGRGSANPPRLVRLDYAPKDAQRHVALVGKGITFDTGGLSLKPAASMVGMQEDMTGAAEVLAVVRAAAQLELPVRVTGWLCIAENMPSGTATRPGDVLTMADGTTVEVTNTDAEGRLVLADGLVAASRETPDVIVDVATLTGAMLVALGTRYTGIMGDDEPVKAFLEAAERTGELAWALPLPDYIEEELDSRVADMQNANVGNRAAGSLFAGLFLRRFVGNGAGESDAPRIPWLHLDIAGSAMSSSGTYGFTGKGPTGATTRALIAFVAAGGRTA